MTTHTFRTVDEGMQKRLTTHLRCAGAGISLVIMGSFISACPAPAQNPGQLLARLSRQNVVWPGTDTDARDVGKAPCAIVIFKACCASNRTAIRWAVSAHQAFGDSIAFWGIDSDHARSLSKVKPWLASQKVDFTVLQDPSHEIINALHIIAVPTIILLDKEGQEAFRLAGFTGVNQKYLNEKLEDLLKDGIED